MRFELRVIRRSLVLGLAILIIILANHALKAIAKSLPGFDSEQSMAGKSHLELIERLTTPAKPPAEAATPSSGFVLPQPRNVSEALSEPAFVPRQLVVTVDPSNYDPRSTTDLYGNLLTNDMIVVLHETVGSATSAINTFQTPHASDYDQVSYHALVTRDGIIVYLVPPEMRAFGAGNSVFSGPNGEETVRLHPTLPVSVNNFSYHVSLESPSDGRGNSSSHSGYTTAQYRSLGWLVAQTSIPDDRITTHQAVDRSGTRRDPRSFDFQAFLNQLHTFRSQPS